jgi:hypothetical protein
LTARQGNPDKKSPKIAPKPPKTNAKSALKLGSVPLTPGGFFDPLFARPLANSRIWSSYSGGAFLKKLAFDA